MLKTYEPPKFCPYTAMDKQAEFLASDKLEVLFGGAAGAGKSTALLMAATQYLHVPSYRAIIFRKHFTDLTLPGALMDQADKWFWGQPGVTWSARNRTWTFPSGATLKFSYMYKPHDHLRFASHKFHFVGFDHLEVIKEAHYRYMMSRLKDDGIKHIPLRIWSTANPSNSWVRRRFLEEEAPSRLFISSNLLDNYNIDPEPFVHAISKLPEWEKRRLLHGSWYE